MTELPTELADLLTDAAGDGSAWAAFVREHSSLILRTAQRLGGDHDVVMDRYTYVLDRLRDNDHRRLRTFEPGRCLFTTWLAVVSRRLCYDRDRERYGRVRGDGVDRERSRAHRAGRRRLIELIGDDIDLVSLADPANADPERALRTKQLRDAVERAVAKLAADDRLIIRLRYDDDRSAREIAQHIGLPSPFHVYRRIDSVLRRLRLSLKRDGIDDGAA